MSTLWTPSGEHRVPPAQQGQQQERADADAGTSPGVAELPPEIAARLFDQGFEADPETGLPVDPRTGEPFDAEQVAEIVAQMQEAQERLVSIPAAEIVQNHMMGLFELASLHLRRDPPDLAEARLPIDALGLLVDNLADELPERDTLTAALHQLRMAFVELHKRYGET